MALSYQPGAHNVPWLVGSRATQTVHSVADMRAQRRGSNSLLGVPRPRPQQMTMPSKGSRAFTAAVARWGCTTPRGRRST